MKSKALKSFLLLLLVFSNISVGAITRMDETQRASLVQTEYIDYDEETGEDVEFVRISRDNLQRLEKQAVLNASLLQRIRDLEKLYKEIEKFVDGLAKTVRLIERVLDVDSIGDLIPDVITDIFDNGEHDFEHISGVVLSPGVVTFDVETSDPNLAFRDYRMKELDFDLYFNTKLFKIDHIEGDGVFGKGMKIVPLRRDQRDAKARIKLPLSDVLNTQTQFKVFFAPVNHKTIDVGDSSKVEIKYYKRVPENENGERIAPVDYDYAPGSPESIKVAVN